MTRTTFPLLLSFLVTSSEGFQLLGNNRNFHFSQKPNSRQTLSTRSATTHHDNARGASRSIKLWSSSSIASSTMTEQEIEALLETGNVDKVIDSLKSQTSSISSSLGAKLINAAATIAPINENEETKPTSDTKEKKQRRVIIDPISGGTYEASDLVSGAEEQNNFGGGQQQMVSPIIERRLVECYNLLFKGDNDDNEEKSLFGKISMNDLPLPYTLGCTIDMLEEKTGMSLSAFRPNPTSTRLYYLGGAGLCLLEVILSQVLQIPAQPLFTATFAAVFADQILSGGALSEKIFWTVQPKLSNRVVRHEAGHLLVAHLLGCPVQSISLGAWDALTKATTAAGGFQGAGTAFFDPDLNAASQKGIITRSVIDRYSIVVMAGIAAEAMNFGDSEGGSDDERTLTMFLSQTIQAKGDLSNIPEQARWAATNALLLLREHKDAYERLVQVLETEGSADIGKIIMAMEGRS